MKRVNEGVLNVNERRDKTWQELKTEIQKTKQEVLAAIKFSEAESEDDIVKEVIEKSGMTEEEVRGEIKAVKAAKVR